MTAPLDLGRVEGARPITCDKRGCDIPAAWEYQVVTLYGVEIWYACQPHVREIRDMHGRNVQHVRKVMQP